MNVSKSLISDRSFRALWLAAAAAVVIGFLVLGDTWAVRALGSLSGILIGLLLKVTSELYSQVRHLDEALRTVEQEEEAAVALARETRAQIPAIHDRLRRYDTVLLAVERRSAEARQKADARFAEIHAQLRGMVDDLAASRIEVPVESARRHSVTGSGAMDELSLGDALSGLALGDHGAD